MLDSNEGNSVSFEHDFNQYASRQVEYKETFVLVASGSSRSTRLDWDQTGSYWKHPFAWSIGTARLSKGYFVVSFVLAEADSPFNCIGNKYPNGMVMPTQTAAAGRTY